MKFIVALSAVALSASVAQAADMAVKAPRVAPLQVTDSWYGFYAGIQGGWNLGRFDPFFAGSEDVEARNVNLKDNSPFVGGQIGFLAQNGAFVFGPEVGIQYWGFKSEAELTPAVPAVIVDGTVVVPAEAATLLQQKIDWLVYANVRFGVTPFSGVLLYVTGGAAWAHVKGQVINVAEFNTAFEQSVLGWNAGLGVEVKLGTNWSLGAQYTHFDFGDVQAANPAVALIGLAPDRLKVDQIRGSLNYRFSAN